MTWSITYHVMHWYIVRRDGQIIGYAHHPPGDGPWRYWHEATHLAGGPEDGTYSSAREMIDALALPTPTKTGQ